MERAFINVFVISFMLGVSVAFYVDLEDQWASLPSNYDPSETQSARDLQPVSKRYSISPACRQCLSRPSDWRACTSCYGNPGPVPFFGFEKRAQESTDFFPPAAAAAGGDGDGLTELDNLASTVQKRSSFLTCRCCISLNNRHCCEKCSLTPYYGKRAEPRVQSETSAVAKRGFQTSYFPMGFYGSSICNVCCNKETYDFVCCAYTCSKRK